MRVVLADDHAMFRQGIRALLEQRGIEVLGDVADGRAASLLAQETRPDIAIFDVSMPLMNGIEATRELSRFVPPIRTILLTMHEEDIYVLEALRAGACGYVLKAQAAADLIEAIQQVDRGEVYLSPGITSRVVGAYVTKTESPAHQLSGREHQVLQLIVEGKTTREIGNLLGISGKTAESHRARIMRKLDVRGTASLVYHAIRHGMVKA